MNEQVMKWFEKIDKVLINFIICVFGVLFFVQIIMMVPGMGRYMNTALRMEGEPIKEEWVSLVGQISNTPWAIVNLELLDYVSLPEVKVFVDGKEAGNFINNMVTLTVKDGNRITVINPDQNLPIKVMLSKKTDNILHPPLKAMVSGTGTLFFEEIVIK